MQVFNLFEFVFDVGCALALSERFAAKTLDAQNTCEHDSKPIE
jgi:hypothetical protein